MPRWTNLLAYPASEVYYPRFFEGEFAISRSQYYAAVPAILEICGEWPAAFVESRRAFFLFGHLAYHIALGRRPNRSPLIVYAQHFWSEEIAQYRLEEFPQTRFIHTIRDPLSIYNSLIRTIINAFPKSGAPYPIHRHAFVGQLTCTDRPHPVMESRTRTIKFEDLHCDPARIIREISCWPP